MTHDHHPGHSPQPQPYGPPDRDSSGTGEPDPFGPPVPYASPDPYYQPVPSPQPGGYGQPDPYHQQDPYGQQPAYGQQPPYGQQAPYGQQLPYGQQAPYGQEFPSGQQPAYGQAPYGQQLTYGPGPVAPPMPYGQSAPAWAVPKPSPMPDGPREYQQMLRGPRFRWWRPLLALLLAAGIAIPLMLLAYLPVVLAGFVAGVGQPFLWAGREISKLNDLGPAGFLYVNLSLIVLIPAAGLSIWAVHRIRPRYLSSVQGGIRWRWLLRCVVIVVPIWALYLGIGALIEPATSPRPAQWGLLLVIVVFLTPLQAAGEEYLFRGWVMQNVGAWFRRPMVGLVVSLAVSVTAFSAAHGSPDIWVLGSLGVFALTAGIATWRTGGLEAGIAIHAVNNIGVFFLVILMGGWNEAFVGADTTGSPVDVGIALLVHGVALAVILWQAKRVGIQRTYLPPAQPAALPVSTASPSWQPVPGV